MRFVKILFSILLTFQLSVSSATVCGNYLGCIAVKKESQAKPMCPHHKKMQAKETGSSKQSSSQHEAQCKCCVVLTGPGEFSYYPKALTTIRFIDFIFFETHTQKFTSSLDRPPILS